MPGCIVSAMTASFRSVEKRRRRATPVITSTFENMSDIGVCLGLYLGPPAKAGVRSKRGAVHRAAGDPSLAGGLGRRLLLQRSYGVAPGNGHADDDPCRDFVSLRLLGVARAGAEAP